MSNPSKLLSQVGGAFAGPAQSRTRIATRHRLNQPLQGFLQTGIGIATALATSPWFAQTRIHRCSGIAIPRSQLRQSLADGVRRHMDCSTDGLNSTPPIGPGLARCPLPTYPLIH